MKMNLKLEVLKVFLMDFNWETGKKEPAAEEIVYEKETTVDNKPALTDQTQTESK
jgi:hypothetical protein